MKSFELQWNFDKTFNEIQGCLKFEYVRSLSGAKDGGGNILRRNNVAEMCEGGCDTEAWKGL